MRFIIHELPYERPLLAGRLRYEHDGRPTGAVESWRLTDAVDGYRFLRVDLDAREAASGRSWLYHMTLNQAGRPEQLKYRFWSDGLEVSGSVIWEGDSLIASRKVNGNGYEDTARGAAFWFPTGVGLSQLLWSTGETNAVTLLTDTAEPSGAMALVETQIIIELGEAEMTTIDGEILPIRPLSVSWAANRRVVWVDTDGRPLRLWRDDGLTAAAERLVRYSG